MMSSVSEKRELKPEQQKAAHTLDRHVSVTAGPGSGKTTVLVERFLHILQQNRALHIDQIVAITFTNRAANEMRERLRKNLDSILKTCSEQERPRWMRYKRTLDGALINTIHGFCARLLREFPVEAAIDPQFLLLDQHDSAILLEAAVEETLTELISSEDQLTSELAVGFGRGKLALALSQLYTNVRGQGLRQQLLRTLTEANHSTTGDHATALAELDRAMNVFLTSRRLSPSAENRRAYASANWSTLRTLMDDSNLPRAEYCSRVESFRESARPKGTSLSCVTALDQQLWGGKKEGTLGLVPQIRFDLLAKKYSLAMIDALKKVERRYRDKKSNLTALDFDDLQLRALELLDHPAVLSRATHKYRFLLVDEFQDTNGIQRELMHKLALQAQEAGANLFIVGDRKQSIYGFRGADVDVFAQTTDTLLAAGGVEQPLHLNFRSQPPLIKFVNYLFPRLFAPPEDLLPGEEAELGFVEFEPSSEQREEKDHSPLVELLLDAQVPDGEDPLGKKTNAERDAGQVAQCINEFVQSGSQYRDIAMLFRAMTDISTYESVLRTANIPFQTVQGKGFFERSEISDLIQLLRFLDNKTDELALAAILRSPLVGLSDNALFALRCAPKVNEVDLANALQHFYRPRNLLYALRHHREIAYIGERDHSQLDLANRLLDQLIEHRNHYAIAELLRFAVEASEYLTVIAANFDGAQRIANVQKLFTLAERFERAGAHLVRDFVRYVEEFEAIGSREGEGQIDDSADAVKLMTIHQAKGLEFPIVIIPSLHYRGMRPQEQWFALDRYRGLSIKVPDGRGKQVTGKTIDNFRRRARLREYAESIRLLYVAATRAQDRLVLSGVTDELKQLQGAPDNWLKLVWQKLELQVSQSAIVELDDAKLAIRLNIANESTRSTTNLMPHSDVDFEIPSSLTDAFPLLRSINTNAEEASSQRVSVTQLINYRRCPRQYYFDRVLELPSADELAVWNNAEAPEPPANLTATLKGAVIHRFCETYSRTDNLDKRLRDSFADVVNSRAHQLPDRLFEIDVDEAIKELRPLAENYLGSELFRRIEEARVFGQDKDAPGDRPGVWSEISFRLRRPLAIISGTIDKLLVLPNSDGGGYRVEVIDFKTNKFSSPLLSEPELVPAETHRLNRPDTGGDGLQFLLDFEVPQATCTGGPANSITDEVSLAARDYELQMQVYALAIRQLMPQVAGSGPLKATLHFLQPNVEFTLDSDLLTISACTEALDAVVLRLMQSKEPNEFPVLPARHCYMCNFLEACREGRDWTRTERRRPHPRLAQLRTHG